MNIRNFDGGDPGVDSLFSFLNIGDLKQFNSVPNASGRYLDLVMSNSNCLVSPNNSSLTKEDVHHPTLNVQLSIVYERSTLSIPRKIRLFHKANYSHIDEVIAGIDWYDLLDGCNICGAVNKFYDTINLIISLLKAIRSILFGILVV